MKTATLIASLLSLSALTACGGTDATNGPNATGRYDDWVLLQQDAATLADASCVCRTYYTREALPANCKAAVASGDLAAALRDCEFPPSSQPAYLSGFCAHAPCAQKL